VIFLKDGEFGVMSEQDLKIFNFNLKPQKIVLQKINTNLLQIHKGKFSCFMEQEIWQSAKACSNTIFGLLQDKKAQTILMQKLKTSKNIHIVACGTALHAGMIFKYLLEYYCKLVVSLDFASEFRYKNPFLSKDSLCFFISQSGETADTLASLELAKTKKAFCVAITNSPQSTITRFANLTLQTNAGPEVAVASTKAFFAQMSAIYYIHTIFCQNSKTKQPFFVNEILKTAKILEKFLPEKNLEKIVPLLSSKQSLFFVGRGLDYLLSLEGALKLKEITYIHCEAFAGGELKHGAISLITKGTPVVALAIQEKILSKMISNTKEG